MKVTYHGHSVIQVETKTHNIIFDPFLTGNSLTNLKPEEVKRMSSCLLTDTMTMSEIQSRSLNKTMRSSLRRMSWPFISALKV